MSHPGQVLSCQEIAHSAWRYNLDPRESGDLIRPYISRLRGKLEANPKEPQYIHTVHGQGYLFASSRRNISDAAKYSI